MKDSRMFNCITKSEEDVDEDGKKVCSVLAMKEYMETFLSNNEEILLDCKILFTFLVKGMRAALE